MPVGFMLSEIRRQPEFLMNLLSRRREFSEILTDSLSGKVPRDIYAFGCGDGYFAATAATCAFVQKTGPLYRGVSSLDFLACYSKIADESSLLLPISMSGNVDRTVEALIAGLKQGSRAIPITNSISGLLANHSALAFQLGIQEPAPFLAGTITYTSSLLALFMISLELVDFSDPLSKQSGYKELEDSIQRAADSLSGLESQLKQWVEAFHGSRKVYFLGSGANLGTARYAASKFVELTHTHAIPQDLEEFAHSNFWQFDSKDLVVILGEAGELGELAHHNVAILKDYGTQPLLITNDSVIEDNVVHIPPSSEKWSPLLFSMPIQLLAYYWSLKDGLNPDRRGHLKNDTARFKTNRMLARKSLV